ncbi:MAG: PASTA domain-containing protein [Lachnospiraceae bacterium]|nr:PASTA domain-containing protein [Lachnospiraceae bacterium]
MRKRWLRLIAVMCVLVLTVGLLTACEGNGDTKEREKKSGSNGSEDVTTIPEATPTGEVTPTGDPTPSAEATPTPEATPTGEVPPSEYTMPDLLGTDLSEALQTLCNMPITLNIRFDPSTEFDDNYPSGAVIKQVPIGGEPLYEGDAVWIIYNSGVSVATPTPEATPTVGPTQPVTAKLREQKSENGAFSVMLPDDPDATIQHEKNGFWVKNKDYYFDVWYIDTGFTGAIYDTDDLMTMIYGENTMIDLLSVDYYDRHGDFTKKTINGVSAVVGPDADIELYPEDGSDKMTAYTRFIAYDCEYEYGLIVVSYMLYGVTCETITDADRELDALLMSCAESLRQYQSPVDYKLDHYAKRVGNVPVEFLCVSGSIKEVEDTDTGVQILPYGTQDCLISIIAYKCNESITNSEEMYKAMKETYLDTTFSELGDAIEREGYYVWDMVYKDAGKEYIETVYCGYVYDQDTLLILDIQRPSDDENAAEDLMIDLLWSLKFN